MSFYIKLSAVLKKFLPLPVLFKYGFNWSPMYRRTTARVVEVAPDFMRIKVKLPKSYKNINYMGSIFGGSMFAAVDPIPMTQLVQLIGDSYVVWDKKAQIQFKRPAHETLYATFNYSTQELDEIKRRVKEEREIEIIKTTFLTNSSKSITYCQVDKTIYIASKNYYREKLRLKKLHTTSKMK